MHSNPHAKWSTTTALLHQIKPGTKLESVKRDAELKKRKVKTALEFMSAHEVEFHCPLNAMKKQKLMTPLVEVRKETKVDPKSVEVQNRFLKRMAEEEMQRGSTSGKRTAEAKKAKTSPPRKETETRSMEVEKNVSPGKKTRRPYRRKNHAGSKNNRNKNADEGSSVKLNKSFWEKASKVFGPGVNSLLGAKNSILGEETCQRGSQEEIHS